jgi:hypothetical protein
MVTVTLTQGANVVNIVGSLGFGSQFYHIPINHLKVDLSDGTDIVYFGGITRIVGNIELKGVSYSQGNALRNWIINYASYQENTFTISAIVNVDLGRGLNTALTLVKFGKTDLEGVFEYIAPGMFNINFPYYFKL